MRKETLTSALCLSLALPLTALAAVQTQSVEPTTRQYIGADFSWLLVDKDRDSQRHGGGYDLFYGRQISSHFWWESTVSFYNQPTDLPGDNNYYQYHLMSGLAYAFGDRRGLTPYLIAQLGAIHHEVLPTSDNATSFGANAGGGLVTGSLFDNGLRLRLDGRYVFDNFDGDHATASIGNGAFGDWRLSLGLEFPLGRTRLVVREKTVVKTREVQVNTPFVDTDKDSVPDTRDQCPGTLAGAKVDSQGCLIPDQNIVLKDILFELGSDKLTSASQRNLQTIAASLAAQPDIYIEVAGNTDSSGSADYNLGLSQKRAESVRSFLSQQGILADHITAKGYGETNPIANNKTASGRAMNRRVELHISKKPTS